MPSKNKLSRKRLIPHIKQLHKLCSQLTKKARMCVYFNGQEKKAVVIHDSNEEASTKEDDIAWVTIGKNKLSQSDKKGTPIWRDIFVRYTYQRPPRNSQSAISTHPWILKHTSLKQKGHLTCGPILSPKSSTSVIIIGYSYQQKCQLPTTGSAYMIHCEAPPFPMKPKSCECRPVNFNTQSDWRVIWQEELDKKLKCKGMKLVRLRLSRTYWRLPKT